MKDKQCFICIAKAIKENTKNITLTQKAAWFRGDKSLFLISLIALPEAFEVGGLFFCLYFVPIFLSFFVLVKLVCVVHKSEAPYIPSASAFAAGD